MKEHFVRVFGRPAPQGSKRAFVNRATGKAVAVDMGGERLRDWRAAVADAAGRYAEEHAEEFPIAGRSVSLVLRFYYPRPANHYSAKGGVKESFLLAPVLVSPDLSKVIRSTEDALVGLLIQDDKLVTELRVSKEYADPRAMGCQITIELL